MPRPPDGVVSGSWDRLPQGCGSPVASLKPLLPSPRLSRGTSASLRLRKAIDDSHSSNARLEPLLALPERIEWSRTEAGTAQARKTSFPESLKRRVLLTAYVVNSLADDPSASSGLTDGKVSLREAITAANTNAAFGDAAAGQADLTGGPTGDTITFATSLSGQTITLSGQQLAMSDELSITGLGATQLTVSGNQLSRVFSIAADATVAISRLTIAGGLSAANGGGIYNAGTLTLMDDNVSGNASNGADGGGIFSAGTLTLTDSTVAGNSASSGGGIFSAGVAVLTSSSVVDNSAGQCGGIYNDSAGTVSLTNSSVSDNSSDFYGGIYNRGTLTLTGSTVSGNTCIENGGGIYNRGTMTVTSSSISDNTAIFAGGIFNVGPLTLTNSSVSGNTAGLYGGGIWNLAALAITSSTISGNVADAEWGEGGGIYNSGTLTLSNSTVSGNSAGFNGGGLALLERSAATLRNVTIFGNRSDSNGDEDGTGGGIYVEADSGVRVTLYNTLVAGNVRGELPGTPNDIDGSVDAASSHNLAADAFSAGGLRWDTNIVGIGWANVINPNLADNGGPTLTHALTVGSTAINAGANANAFDALGNPLTTDQRGIGYPRVSNGTVDIGAVERPKPLFTKQDFNRDGLADVAEMKSNGEWWVGLSNGTDTFTEELWAIWADASNWSHVDFGDFNGDDVIDIVGITRWGGIWVALSNGTDRFLPATRWFAPKAVPIEWLHAGVGDFDGNGYADIAGFSPDGRWDVAFSDKTSRFEIYVGLGNWADESQWADFELGDFDHDGATDVAGFTHWGGWWVGLFKGRFFHTRWAKWADASKWGDLEIGDFNSDGSDDVAGFDISGNWWIGTSTGTAFDAGPLAADWESLPAWGKIGVGDVNDDGFTDLAAFSVGGGWWIGLNDATGGFNTSRWSLWEPSSKWAQLDLLDVNGSQNFPPDKTGRSDVVGFDHEGRWKVGLSYVTGNFGENSFWANWDPSDTWATLNDGLRLRRQLDRLSLV